jgi:iron(III) transport system permease protein
MTATRIIAPLLWPHCLAGAILIFSIAFRELVGSVLLRPPGMQTVSTFILRERDLRLDAVGFARAPSGGKESLSGKSRRQTISRSAHTPM